MTTVPPPAPAAFALPDRCLDWRALSDELGYRQVHREDLTVAAVAALLQPDRSVLLREIVVRALVAGASRRVRRAVTRRGPLLAWALPREGHPDLLLIDRRGCVVLVVEAKLWTTNGNELQVSDQLRARVRANAADVARAGVAGWDVDGYLASALADGFDGAVAHQFTAYYYGLQVSGVRLIRSRTTFLLWTEHATGTARDLGYGYVPLAAHLWATARWTATRAALELTLLDASVRAWLPAADRTDLVRLYRMLLGR